MTTWLWGMGMLSIPIEEGQRHIKKVITELGGKNAVIVDSSADPDEAVTGIVQSAFGFQGQKCSACSRVIVVGKQYQAFVERLIAATRSLVISDPADPACDVGPVINAAAKRKIETYIAQADHWGSLAYQAKIDESLSGHFVGPTIVKDVDPNTPLAQDEIFGPVLAIIPAQDFDTALKIANDTQYALTGGVYSRNPDHLELARKRFNVGNLYLNRGITGALVNRQPFGGYKLSGIGSKAGGKEYLQQFMLSSCITETTMRRGFAPET